MGRHELLRFHAGTMLIRRKTVRFPYTARPFLSLVASKIRYTQETAGAPYLDGFFERLKQRKLVQWALAYVAAAFALIQVLDIVAQRFGWPTQAIRLAIVILAIGFFVALVLAWYHGERGSQRISGTELLILALLLAVGGTIAWRLAPSGADPTIASDDQSSKPAQSVANPNSIAVMPFVNMSGDKDNEYFSDGISEELLNVLARIPELQVAARTSSFSFKDQKKEVPDIARELRVRMLLEGSVRKQSDRVRITAQLIDASNGYHVWSQTYDRELKDIFAIQDEIANAIANELKVKMGNVDQPTASTARTKNVEAYDFYLRGLTSWQIRGETELLKALDNFKHAIALDPTFAEAYAGLALDYAIISDYSARITYDESLALAKDNAERALALDPTIPESYVVIAYMADGDRRRETAQALYRRAIDLRPSFATAHQWLGNSLWSGGKLDEGIAALEHASALDPKSSIIANNHGMALIAAGRYDEAKALCESMLKANADDAQCLEMSGFASLAQDDLNPARDVFTRYAKQTNPSAVDEVRDVFDALEGHGDRHAVAAHLATFMPQSSYDPRSGNTFNVYIIPTLLVKLGESKLVVQNINKFADTDRSGQSEWALMQAALGPLHCDADFVALVKHLKTTDPHYAKLCSAKP
jgi:adenylate cyclase